MGERSEHEGKEIKAQYGKQYLKLRRKKRKHIWSLLCEILGIQNRKRGRDFDHGKAERAVCGVGGEGHELIARVWLCSKLNQKEYHDLI